MHKEILISGLILCYSTSCSQQTATFTDSRDGKTYKTVTIGIQTWMAENLNFQTPDFWYYADSPGNDAKYGQLYTWEVAKNARPECWYLPSKEKEIILECHLGMIVEIFNEPFC
jgi:hypothetical protein